VAERFERLEETLRIAQRMWAGDQSPTNGRHYQLRWPLNSPAALSRPHPRVMIGGSGERKTLRLVAQYADACNLFEMTRRRSGTSWTSSGALRRRRPRTTTRSSEPTLGSLGCPRTGAAARSRRPGAVDRFAAYAGIGVDHAISQHAAGVYEPERFEADPDLVEQLRQITPAGVSAAYVAGRASWLRYGVFSKILVANRGEIAVRALRAAYELGARTVASFPGEDRNAVHRIKADEAYLIGERGHPSAPTSTSTRSSGWHGSGADAVYPGLRVPVREPGPGRGLRAAGIAFVGPAAAGARLAGNKVRRSPPPGRPGCRCCARRPLRPTSTSWWPPARTSASRCS
jgi:hypothetical protein